jgi:hypothetical protein
MRGTLILYFAEKAPTNYSIVEARSHTWIRSPL